eukprot:3933588-Rhodomonas_salina.2
MSTTTLSTDSAIFSVEVSVSTKMQPAEKLDTGGGMTNVRTKCDTARNTANVCSGEELGQCYLS